jgi:hypothetical protein
MLTFGVQSPILQGLYGRENTVAMFVSVMNVVFWRMHPQVGQRYDRKLAEVCLLEIRNPAFLDTAPSEPWRVLH